MTKLSRSELFKTGKVLVKEEKSKSFIKQIATINNQFIDLKIINAMVEDNIYLNIVDNNIKLSHIQKLRNKSKQLQIRIILQGKLEKLNHSTNEKRVYNKNEISLEYEENIEESLLNKQGQHLKYICITLDEKYLSENGFFSNIFKENFSKKLYEPDLGNRFYELFNREYTSGLDKIYLKNKTMETILYVLEKVEKLEKLNLIGLDEEDVKRIKKAKVIIDESFQENITIAFLSKKVALNQTKLKKGFKQLFDRTVHEYLKNIRLEKAVEYLKINKYSIKEVSLMVGYTNQGSFSYAFSNKYDCLPKDVQKKSNL
jgi:AraC-like DNA-binding protein